MIRKTCMIKGQRLFRLTAISLAVCISGAAVLSSAIVGKSRPVYDAHSSAVYLENGGEDEILYEYQWMLKNNGQIRLVEKTSGSVLMTGSGVSYGQVKWEADDKKAIQALPGIDIRAEEAWELYEQVPEKKTVTVALIDTGVDISHPELAAGILLPAMLCFIRERRMTTERMLVPLFVI